MYSLARPQTFFPTAPRRPTPPARRPAGRPPSPAAKKMPARIGGSAGSLLCGVSDLETAKGSVLWLDFVCLMGAAELAL
jgi:hypothetical protein